jgi:RHS repeat-associated protein
VVEYYHTDALGSVRAVTKVVNGQTQVVSRHDYRPFGEEVAPQTPPVDKRLFTGKERDAETGLDYFGARYLSCVSGRFVTADPLTASAQTRDPRTFNRYSYALNNPLKFQDPDGLEVPKSCVNNADCTILVKLRVIWDRNANDDNGVDDAQKRAFEAYQLARLRKDFGNSNIILDVTYAQGVMRSLENVFVDHNRVQGDRLNVFVSNRAWNTAGAGKARRSEGFDAIFIGLDRMSGPEKAETGVNTMTHEMAHVYLHLDGGFLTRLGGLVGLAWISTEKNLLNSAPNPGC